MLFTKTRSQKEDGIRLQGQQSSRTTLKRERRRDRRALYSVPIELRFLMPGGVRSRHGISLDISESGIGALMKGDLIVGETVEFDLQLPRCSLFAMAVVKHASTTRSGFEFLGLTPAERRQIEAVAGRTAAQ